MGEIKVSYSLWNVSSFWHKSLKPCCEARSGKNTKVLHLVPQGRYPLFAYSCTNEKETTIKSGLLFLIPSSGQEFLKRSATGHSVLPQFLSRKEFCECHICLALSQVQSRAVPSSCTLLPFIFWEPCHLQLSANSRENGGYQYLLTSSRLDLGRWNIRKRRHNPDVLTLLLYTKRSSYAEQEWFCCNFKCAVLALREKVLLVNSLCHFSSSKTPSSSVFGVSLPICNRVIGMASGCLKMLKKNWEQQDFEE